MLNPFHLILTPGIRFHSFIYLFFIRQTRRQAEARESREKHQEVLPSDEAILAIVREAADSATDTARYLGMEVDMAPHFPECLNTDRIQAHLPQDDDDQEDDEVSSQC